MKLQDFQTTAKTIVSGTTCNSKSSYFEIDRFNGIVELIKQDKPCSYCGIIDYKHNQCQRCGAPKS